MGANLARRLHDVGFPIVALYGARPEAAAEVAAETGGEVSASLAPQGDSLLTNAKGRVFLNCATVTPRSIATSSG